MYDALLSISLLPHTTAARNDATEVSWFQACPTRPCRGNRIHRCCARFAFHVCACARNRFRSHVFKQARTHNRTQGEEGGGEDEDEGEGGDEGDGEGEVSEGVRPAGSLLYCGSFGAPA